MDGYRSPVPGTGRTDRARGHAQHQVPVVPSAVVDEEPVVQPQVAPRASNAPIQVEVLEFVFAVQDVVNQPCYRWAGLPVLHDGPAAKRLHAPALRPRPALSLMRIRRRTGCPARWFICPDCRCACPRSSRRCCFLQRQSRPHMASACDAARDSHCSGRHRDQHSWAGDGRANRSAVQTSARAVSLCPAPPGQATQLRIQPEMRKFF